MMLRKTIWFLVLEIFVTAVISSTIEDRTPTEDNLKPVDGDIHVVVKSKQADVTNAMQPDLVAYFQQPTTDTLNTWEKATPLQIERAADVLRADLPNLFLKPQSLDIYHEDMIFDNCVSKMRTKTIQAYKKQLDLLKMYCRIRYKPLTMDLLKVTTHPEDGSIRVRWRIRGTGRIKGFINTWKERLFRNYVPPLNHEEWLDGFSVFYVYGDGLIHKTHFDANATDSRAYSTDTGRRSTSHLDLKVDRDRR